MSKPLVSVIIPTCRGADSIKRAVDSVLDQSCDKLEIIVVDDNDPESEARKLTGEIIASYKNGNLRYICHEKNLNGSAARNTGVKYAEGEIVSFLDDDDVLLPWRISEAAASIQQGNDIVFTNVLLQKYHKLYAAVRMQPNGKFFYTLMKNPSLIGTGSNLFLKKDLYQQVGGFDETLTRHQDYEFLIRVFSEEIRTGFLDDYSIIKIMDRSRSAAHYNELKEIKAYLFEKNKTIIEHFLNKDEIKEAMIAHHTELLYTAILENNRPGIREQKEILQSFGRNPQMNDYIRALIKRYDRTELIQKSFSMTSQRKILDMLKNQYPECYAYLESEGYFS